MRHKYKKLLPVAATLILMFSTLGLIVEQVPMDICPKCHSREHTTKDWVLPHETVDAFYSSHNYNYYYEIPHPEKIPGGFQAWFCVDCRKGWIHPWFTIDVFDQGGPPPNEHKSFFETFSDSINSIMEEVVKTKPR